MGSRGRDVPGPAPPLRCRAACCSVSRYRGSVSVAVTGARRRRETRDAQEVSPRLPNLRVAGLCVSALTEANAAQAECCVGGFCFSPSKAVPHRVFLLW